MKVFEFLLVFLTVASGLILLAERLFLAKRRARRAGLLDTEPAVLEYSRAFFPVLLVVLVVRSFIAEPYKIPSSSMMPNLLIGDFILVNKFAYGLRLPLTNTKVVPLGEPARGDVVVFHYPGRAENDPAKGENFIKRVIGVPGDTVAFQGNGVILNGEPLAYEDKGIYAGHHGQGEGDSLLLEQLPGRPHTVLETSYPAGQGEWTVPAGKYLVMGDNRDNSDDGRFWGLLPEENLRGKAFGIWLNCSGWFCKDGFEPSRIGSGIN